MGDFEKKTGKYITLKEASKMTGYSPDYLGQLIRKGKLTGKQVYLNVAWVTTEEAIREYLEKNKAAGVGKIGFSQGIKEKLRRWALYYSSGEQVIRMARRVLYFIAFLLILFCLFLLYALLSNMFHGMTAHAATGVPKVLSYQGRLFDVSGNLLGGAGTAYCFQFSLFNATSGGSQLWPVATASIMTVNVKNGVFNVGVGDTSAGGDALTYDFQTNDTVYLDVAVGSQVASSCAGVTTEHLSPRQRVVASGYAINSYSLGGFTPSQNATGSQIPVLSGGNLMLAGINPQINATGTNTLTLQGGGGTGNIQFFGAGTFFTAAGLLQASSTITGNLLQATATSSQFIFNGVGASGTLSWTPTVAEALTIPNFGTSTDTVVLVNYSQALNNKTLNSPTINTSTLNTATINNATLNSPILSAVSILQNAAGTGLLLIQNATGTAFAIMNNPTSTQATSTVNIIAGNNVSGAALLVQNFGSGNSIQVNDSSSVVFTINGAGNTAFRPSNDTSTAFILQNASGTNTLFAADTINNQIKIGDNGSAGTVPTLLGLDIKADANDPTGFNGAMYYSSSSQVFRCYQNGLWYNCVPTNMQWQPVFFSNRWGDWSPSGITATALSSTNMVAAVTNGAGAASAQAEGYYVQWTSSGALGASAGATSTFAETEPRYTPRAATRIRTDSAITSRRIWFALSSAKMDTTNGTGSLATIYFGLGYSTQATSTDWLCGSGDGVNASTMDTGVPVTANTYYDFILDATTLGQLTCQVATNGGNYVSVTKLTNIPTSTTALGIQNITTALTAAAVVHRMAFTYIGNL